MIRFKVIHASRLAVWAAAIVLAVVVAALVLRLALAEDDLPAALRYNESNMVMDATQDKEAAAAFAAAARLSKDGTMPLSPDFSAQAEPDQAENEHTDPQAPAMQIEILTTRRPAAVSSTPVPQIETATEGTPPRVLIYHTHTHEAYEQVADDPYEETEKWRTEDEEHSVVRVGRELAECLRARGIEVVHDTTDHEPPKLGTAYVRSLETLESYDTEEFDCYIDLHRDAYIEGMRGVQTLSVNGAQTAQLMILIGNGDGFEVKPDYAGNLEFARNLTDRINALAPGLCKDVMVKTGRYNQHIGKNAILVEVGNNMNTLSEALSAMPTLADALAAQLTGGPVPDMSAKSVPVTNAK